MLRDLLSAGARVTLGRAGGTLSIFLLNIWVVRRLETEDAAAFLAVFLAVTIIATAARFGLEQVGLKVLSDILAGRRGRIGAAALRRLVLLSAISIGLFVGIYIAAADWLWTRVLPFPELIQLTPLIAIWIGLLAIQVILGELLRALRCFFLAALCRASSIYLLALCGLLWFDLARDFRSLELCILLIDVSVLVAVVAAVIIGLREFRIQTSAFPDSASSDDSQIEIDYSSLIRFAVPLWLAQLATIAATHADGALVGAFFEPVEMSGYILASRLAVMVTYAIGIANGVLPPYIAEFRQRQDTARLQTLVGGVAFACGVPALIALLVFTVWPGEVLTFFYGEKYVVGAPVLRALAVAQAVAVWVGSCGYCLIMYGHGRAVLMAAALPAALALMLSFLLIQSGFGIAYVALVQAMGIIFQQLWMLWLAKGICGFWTFMRPVRPRWGS